MAKTKTQRPPSVPRPKTSIDVALKLVGPNDHWAVRALFLVIVQCRFVVPAVGIGGVTVQLVRWFSRLHG
jgi:hypothetical protein